MKKVKVLIVDDDRDLCENLSKILGIDGYEVEFCLDGLQALSRLKSGPFEIMVLDLKMPGMDGMRLLKEMPPEDRPPAVIILTAYPTIETAMSAVKDKTVFDYIRKPFSMQEIRNSVARAARSLGLVIGSLPAVYAKVGENVRRNRTGKNLTLRELGRSAGLSASLLSQIESGKSSASIKTLFRISQVLKVDLAELVKGL